MESSGFKQSVADPCIFVKRKKDNFAIIAVYVDDLIIVTQDEEMMREIKKSLTMRFKIKDR